MSAPRTPTYVLRAGGAEFSASVLGPLVTLDLRACKNGGADELVVLLGQTAPAGVVPGDPVELELGWDGQTRLVFTGEVSRVAAAIGSTELTALGAQVRLGRTRGDTTYVSQTAGQVVSALAGEAEVDVENADDGLDLPRYFADSGRSHLEHCLALACSSGFDLFCTDEGKLVFAPFSVSAPDHRFRYGIDIVSARMFEDAPLAAVTVVPESPSSSQGADAVSWLLKDPASHLGKAGSGAGLLLSDPLLRSKEAAETAAKARLYFSRRDARGGRLELAGKPDLKLGQAVALEGLPESSADDTYQVLSVRHVLARGRGFRTYAELGGMP